MPAIKITLLRIMQKEKAVDIKGLVFASLFTALTAVGAYIVFPIPMSPVPIVLQNLFVLLAGLLLGSKWAAASVALYISLGALGIPIFSAGRGGLAHLMGPTGGYLLGFLPATYIVGLISERLESSFLVYAFAGIAGSLVIYICGVPWLKMVLALSWEKAVVAGLVPFIIGDVIKIAAASLITKIICNMKSGIIPLYR